MAVPAEVRDHVAKQFDGGEQLGALELMARTGRGRVVYKAINQLLADGSIVVVREERTARRPRKIFGLPGSVAF